MIYIIVLTLMLAQCRPIDLAIVVDVSPAEDDLLHLQTFVASLVDLIDVGEDQNRYEGNSVAHLYH